MDTKAADEHYKAWLARRIRPLIEVRKYADLLMGLLAEGAEYTDLHNDLAEVASAAMFRAWNRLQAARPSELLHFSSMVRELDEGSKALAAKILDGKTDE